MSANHMYWIEKYNLNFQLHIKNSNHSKIFKQFDLKEEVGEVSKFEDVVLDVVSTKLVNEKYYYKTLYKNNLVGWLSPGTSSIKYIKSKKQEVKIKDSVVVDNELNQLLNIDLNKLKDNIIKIFVSDFYAVLNEKIYCAIILKEELLGFIQLEYVSTFVNMRNDFKFNQETVNLYKDSKMNKPVIESFEHKDETFTALGYFDTFDGIRVIVDGKRYWTDIKSTNIEIETISEFTPDDIVIDALINQMNEKNDHQKDFYTRAINILKDEVKTLKEDKKNVRKEFAKLKAIL